MSESILKSYIGQWGTYEISINYQTHAPSSIYQKPIYLPPSLPRHDYHDIEEDREGMDLPEKLTAQPQEVAEDIYKAQQKGKNVLYTKWIWRWVMLIIKIIPEWKFKGMSI